MSKLEASWSGVDRWLVEYDARPLPTVPGLSGARRTVGVAAPGDLYHMGAHFGSGLDWRQDPLCQEYFVHGGATCHQWPFSRIYTPGALRRGAFIPGSIPYELLLSVVPSWPLTDYRLDGGPAWGGCLTPPEAVRSNAYKLLARRDLVGGRKCAVFANDGTDRIWVATRFGFCVVKRERRAAVSHRLLYRVVARKLAQVSAGLWFPIEFRYQLFSPSGPTNRQSLEADYDVRIVRFEIGRAVPDSTFIAPMPPGALEVKADGGCVQTVPGGQDLLDNIAKFAAQNTTHEAAWSLHGGMAWNYARPALALGAGVCVGLSLLRGRKRQAAGRESRDPGAAVGAGDSASA